MNLLAFIRPALCRVGLHDWSQWQQIVPQFVYRRQCMWCDATGMSPRGIRR
jgi:hypothetical protein